MLRSGIKRYSCAMRAATLAVGLMMLACSAQAQTVYRCTEAGRTVYQGTPCPKGGRAIEVSPPRPAAPQGNPTPSRDQAALQQLQRDRERREKWFELRDARVALEQQVRACEQEQARIDSDKQFSANNLAGATRDVSISNEMQAAATLCAAKIGNARSRVDLAEKVCNEIGCIEPR
jgi:hypothetical protein